MYNDNFIFMLYFSHYNMQQYTIINILFYLNKINHITNIINLGKIKFKES